MTSPKSTQGRRNRRRGAASENELVAILRESHWPGAIRGIQFQSRGVACDIENTPLRIECKHRESHSCLRFLEKAEEEALKASDERPTVVALREQGDKRWALLFRLESFEEISKLAFLARELRGMRDA